MPQGWSAHRRRLATAVAPAALFALAATAAVVSNRNHGVAAAHVGSTTITVADVQREVEAIESQPEYANAIAHSNTLALAAPADSRAVAAANGDPDHLRITSSPVAGTGARPYTNADLQAAVLTREMYVAALRQLLLGKHAAPTASEIADGRQEASLHSGIDAAGRSLFGKLPSWYQDELAMRGADVEALVRVEIGTAVVTDAAIQRAYQARLASDFTTVCVRSLVAPAANATAAEATLAAGGPGVRDDGCAPLGQWSPDVATAVRTAGQGVVGPMVTRGPGVALLVVTKRVQVPLTEVAADVRANLLVGYTDLINNVVESELALLPVSVAPRYGTYESFASLHEVLPPDARTPASPPNSAPPSPPTIRAHQEVDPFD